MTLEPRAVTVVAELGARPVGFAVVTASEERAHLDAIAVSARTRGRGVGRALLEHAEALAHSAGARTMVLVTADSNLAALDLFLRSGFEISARLPRFYARGQNALRLTKRLVSGRTPGL
jgi:ribosomal protein S18 acetylase RimI-like enzyme